MLHITRKMTVFTLTTAALAMPAAAQASSPVSAKAVVQASVRAEVQLDQAQRLAQRSSASAHVKATALLARSRGDLRSAVANATRLADRADSAVEVRAAVKTNAKLSSALAEDATGLADIAVKAGGRLASKAAAGLVTDLRMQQDIVETTIELGATADADSQQALEGVISAQQDVVASVNAAAKVAASPQTSAKVKAGANVAVGIGIQTIAAAATSAQKIQASVAGSAASTLRSLQSLLNGAAARITGIIAGTKIGANEVAVSGVGNVALGLLAQSGINVTATASANASVDAGGSARLRLMSGVVSGLSSSR